MRTSTTMRWRLVALAAALVAVLSACADGDDQAGAGAASGDDAGMPSDVVIGGGGTGGVYGIVATALGEVINENIEGVSATAESTAAGLENTRRVRDGSLDFGLSDPKTLIEALEGTGQFADEEPADNLRFVMQGYTSPSHFIVPAGSDAQSPGDLEGARICAGPGVQTGLLLDVLGAYGIGEGDVTIVNQEYTECAAGLQEGAVDVFHYSGGAGASAVIQAFAGRQEMRLLEIDDESLDQILEESPWFVPDTVPAGTYAGQDEEIQTTGLTAAILVTREDMSAELVEELLAAVEANIEEIEQLHPNLSAYRLPESAQNPIDTLLPAHEGAEAFYSEQGIEGYQ